MKELINPCKGCEEREVGCHSNCMGYIEWKKAYNEQKLTLKNIKKQELEYDGYASQQIEKRKRYERRRKS